MLGDEGRFWREFEEARPRILGALLVAIAAGLANLPAITLDQLPRMADFAIWVSACERASGLERGEAFEAHRANCAEAQSRSGCIAGLQTASRGGSGRIQRHLHISADPAVQMYEPLGGVNESDDFNLSAEDAPDRLKNRFPNGE